METDHQLMRRLQAGDTEALSTLVLRHQQRLKSFLTRLCRSDDQAGDLVQETFIRVFEKGRQYSEKASFATWLYTIAYRLFLDLRRKRKIEMSLEEKNMGGREIVRTSADAPDSPEAILLRRDLAAAVRAGIESLPEIYRAVLLLRGIREMPYTDIGVILECSEDAARVRMHKGLSLLRDRLESAGILQRKKE